MYPRSAGDDCREAQRRHPRLKPRRHPDRVVVERRESARREAVERAEGRHRGVAHLVGDQAPRREAGRRDRVDADRAFEGLRFVGGEWWVLVSGRLVGWLDIWLLFWDRSRKGAAAALTKGAARPGRASSAASLPRKPYVSAT